MSNTVHDMGRVKRAKQRLAKHANKRVKRAKRVRP